MTIVVNPTDSDIDYAPREHDDDHTPLADIGAERIVLGAMMTAPEHVVDLAEIIQPRDFYRPAHTIICETIIDAAVHGEPVAPAAILHRLTASGDLQRVGGGDYLHDLYASVPIAAQGAHFAKIVAALAARRSWVTASARAAQVAANLGVDADEARDAVQRIIHDATTGTVRTTTQSITDTIGALIDDTIAPRGPVVAMPTGLTDLDRLLGGGLKPGQLVIAAGRPGMGKSVFAADVARACAVHTHIPTLFASLEMTRTELQQRILAAETTVPLNLIINGGLTDEDVDTLRRRSHRLRDAPLWIDDSTPVTLATLQSAARRADQETGLGLIIVDYLQLMSSLADRYESEVERLTVISRGLKLLAKQLEVPVLALAQLNRESEKRTDRRPQLSDLRGSGSIEQDADVVILLHREDYYDDESPRAGEIDLIVAKHRNGATDTITAAFQGQYSRIFDMAIPEIRAYGADAMEARRDAA